MPDTKVNILLVDDRPDKLLALEAVLEDLGQNIVRAYSGREALRHVLTTDFAVILLDVNMPGMDGFETAGLIRQRKNSEHVPIIFITAMGDEMHVSRGYSLGAVDYILTPVVSEVLRSKVAVFVDLSRKSEQVRRQADSLRRRAAQLQKLAAASVAISSEMAIPRMLQTVTDTARDTIGAHQAMTVFIDPRPGHRARRTQAYASYSDKYAEWRGQPLQLDAIADTAVFRSYTATRLTEAELLEHPDWEIVRNVRVPPIRGGVLAAPLTGRDGARLGVIYLCDRDAAATEDGHPAPAGPVAAGTFTADDEFVAVQLAQMASIAIENTLFAEEREANRIKDEFLSTLSHELRTPLNAILGWTQILQMEFAEEDTADAAQNGNGAGEKAPPKPDPAEIHHALEIIERNARAQTKLIEDLLDVSRITTGKLRLATSVVPAAPIVRAAADAVRPQADAKSVTLACRVTDPDQRIVADPDRLQQVVWNLLVNAVKFTPAGGRVEVSAELVTLPAPPSAAGEPGEAPAPSGAAFQIRVTDTGQGIDPQFLPHVFDRFRQADSSSTRAHGGLGIGLALVRHIVELHGGTVRADSAGDNAGSTFTVTLPILAAATAQIDAAAPAPAATHPADPHATVDAHRPANHHNDLAGLRVLIVDDAPDGREVLALILRRAGAVVTTAASAEEGRRAYADPRTRPDVLVSDIAMPDEDGHAFIRSIRTGPPDQAGATVPALALTAYAREEDRLRALSAGFDAHLSKPVEPAEFIALIARLAAAPTPTRKRPQSQSAAAR
ncbi:MAG TPA: response regulator [Tepidisphaeraceae bacterium]|nr:response regulator [Tepidisphaeraceae bacterium]